MANPNNFQEPSNEKTQNENRLEWGVKERFCALLDPYFELFPEVWMRHASGRRRRIDFIGRSRDGNYPPKGYVGFEIKSDKLGDGYGSFSEALCQAVEYSESVIADGRFDLKDVFLERLLHVFLFPCPYDVYQTCDAPRQLIDTDLWARGAVRLAGQFGVGVIVKHPVEERYDFLLCGHPVYKSGLGRTGVRHDRGARWGELR